MSPYRFFRMVQAMIGFGVFLLGSMIFLGHEVYVQVSSELGYRSRFGADWKQHYEEARHTSVDEIHTKIAIACGGLIVIPTLVYFIYRQAAPPSPCGDSSRRRRRRRR